MTVWQGILLGLLQGLTEFLPISSSGHLALAEHFFGVNVEEFLPFDVAVHFATLLAIIIYFWRDISRLVPGREPYDEDWYLRITGGGGAGYMYLMVALTMVPVAAVYVLWKDDIAALRTEPYAVAGGFIYGGIVLIVSDILALRGKGRGMGLGMVDALLIGLAQSVALAPGVSRSGTTMATGRILGLSKEASFRFAFIMAVPVMAGATAVELKDMAGFGNFWALAAGMAAALVSGLGALAVLRRVVARLGLSVFGSYCVMAGIVTIIIYGRGA
ncbi:MAG: undecaprenyl-diphosphate phosphatase [Planctomycetes bacterium]|nr:undecaprenyl-diphosphate phosphatase [Planctomycetota bacterium]